MKTIYLAGPMSGLPWQTANAWRERVDLSLGPEYRCLSPMRWQPTEILINYDATTDEILRRDFFDVQQADLVLADFTIAAETVSFGTVSELGWAYALRKPTIMVVPEDSIYHHPWMVEMADYVRSDLSEAIKIVRKLLG